MVFGGRRRRHDRDRRRIRDGDAYTLDEELDDQIELEEVSPREDHPPEETRGEPWGWTKGPPYPRGWREDGRYGQRLPEDPGPLDGRWPDDEPD
jgi:hypothetical protein